MVGGYSEPTESEGFTSKFNEAFLKMHRIHKLQDSIIQCSFNLQGYNENVLAFNYQIVLSCVNGIMKEVWGKLTEDEREEVTKKRLAIEGFIKKHPIHENIKNQTNNKSNTRFNKLNWEVLEKYLLEYDLYLRELLTRTGYDSPNNEDYMDGL